LLAGFVISFSSILFIVIDPGVRGRNGAYVPQFLADA